MKKKGLFIIALCITVVVLVFGYFAVAGLIRDSSRIRYYELTTFTAEDIQKTKAAYDLPEELDIQPQSVVMEIGFQDSLYSLRFLVDASEAELMTTYLSDQFESPPLVENNYDVYGLTFDHSECYTSLQHPGSHLCKLSLATQVSYVYRTGKSDELYEMVKQKGREINRKEGNVWG